MMPLPWQTAAALADKILVDFPSRGQNGCQIQWLALLGYSPPAQELSHGPETNAESLMTDKKAPSHADTEESAKAELASSRLELAEVAALVARVRHEINNPLTGVLGQAQLLLREDLSESALKRVQTIEKLALRLNDIVGQLREVKRPLPLKEK